MKALASVSFFLLAGSSLAQADTCRALDSTAVVRMDNTAAEELYARARRWFALADKDRPVVHTTDTMGHTVIGMAKAPYAGGGWIHCTIEIGCREGRYKYRVFDVHHKDPRSSVQASDVGEIEEHPDLGALYDCDACCAMHRAWREAHPKQVAAQALHVEECRTSILGLSRWAVATIISSLRTGMEAQMTTEDDW